MVKVRMGRVTRLWVVALALSALSAQPSTARADARSDYLIETLRDSDSFRVRIQAAVSLGQLQPGEEIIAALVAALSDDHPAVRAAAATSLGRLGDPEALPGLKHARRDSTQIVRRAVAAAIRSLERVARNQRRSGRSGGSSRSGRSTGSAGPTRYYVGIGDPGSRSNDVDRSVLRSAREILERELRSMDGVELAPDGEPSSRARSVIRRRRLTGVYIDSSIVSVEETSRGTRVTVSVILGTYPGRDMRAMLQGRAIAPGEPTPRNIRRAVEGAIRSALRRLPAAMQTSAQR